MRIRSLFFASYRELAGTDQVVVELPPGSCVADLVIALRASGAPFSALPENPAVAINMEYAAPSASLGEGDEVAFIPPVAGG
jgi:molybdopterin converting factor subunit 1